VARSGCDRRPAANTTVQLADKEILVRKQRAVIFDVASMAIVKQASSTLRMAFCPLAAQHRNHGHV
jgi:hypothetical protein